MSIDQPKTSRTQWTTLALLVLLSSMAVRIWLYRQPVNSDDISYFNTAHSLHLGQEVTEETYISHTSLRASLILLVKLAQHLVGYSIEAFYAAVYLNALLFGIALFLLASVLSDIRAGVIVLVLWAGSYVCIEVDTRLLPDNLGTALAMIAIAVLVPGAQLHERFRPPDAEPSRPWSPLRILTGVLAGFLSYAAFSARASFAPFAVAALGIGLLSRHRRAMVAGTAFGLLLGAGAELLYMHYIYGDAWIRWGKLLGYGDALTESKLFTGLTYHDLLTRYPRRLARTESGELWIHWIGLAGVLAWLLRVRFKASAAKLILFLAGYGTIAFALTQLNPPVPFMRDKARYYATAAPMFYLATADLFLWIAGGLYWLSARIVRDDGVSGRSRRRLRQLICAPVLCLMIAALLVPPAVSIHKASENPDLVRNGDNHLLVTAHAIREDAEETHWAKCSITDGRTQRVLQPLLPWRDGWDHSGITFEHAGDREGYLTVNWRRLMSTVRLRYNPPTILQPHYDLLERFPLVMRHRFGLAITDVYRVGPEPLRRERTDITDRLPKPWMRTYRKTKKTRSLPPDQPLVLQNRDYLYTGSGHVYRQAPAAPLAGWRFLLLRLRASAPDVAPMTARLYWWQSPKQKKATSQCMGMTYVDEEPQEIAFWTYLPRDVHSYRIVLHDLGNGRVTTPVTVEDVRLYLLTQDPRDRIRLRGDGW